MRIKSNAGEMTEVHDMLKIAVHITRQPKQQLKVSLFCFTKAYYFRFNLLFQYKDLCFTTLFCNKLLEAFKYN